MDRCVLGLLLLATLRSVRPEGVLLLPVELSPVPCNDRAVERLSRLAVTYINEDRSRGYKFALNRVANVHVHAQGPAGNVYYLDLDVLETKCHTGSSRPWKRCEVRPFMETQVSGTCNTTVLHSPEGYSYLYSYDCALVPDPPETLRLTCPTCPTLLSVDAPEAAAAARVTLARFQRRSPLAAGLGVKEITRAAVQTRPSPAHLVEYTVQRCPEGVAHRGTCRRPTLRSDAETAGFCSGSVSGRSHSQADAQVSCEMFRTQNLDAVRPVLPQGHDFPLPPEPAHPPPPPPPPPPTEKPGNEPKPLVTPPPPAVHPGPVDPAHIDLAPPDPPVVENPPILHSSSSESAELTAKRHQVTAGWPDSSSSEEEVGGPVARRPPFNFRYRGPERRKRQALVESSPSYTPVFLTDFPGGPSPFRSCPGPARYTTA